MAQPVMTPRDGVAWITGASSGIGKALAARLARSGWLVAATARNEDALRDLHREAQSFKGDIISVPADVTDKATLESAVERIEKELGSIALAVFNAGVYAPIDAARFDAEVFRKTVDVNLQGVANGLEPLIPRMIGRGVGHIAIVSSVNGYGGLPTSSAYGATKAALINMAEALYIELARWNVRVSVITPGFVATPAQDGNAFDKPFIMSAAAAADRIAKGLRSQSFEITFPKRFSYQLKFLNLLPRSWRLSLVRRRTGWNKRPEDGGSKAGGQSS